MAEKKAYRENPLISLLLNIILPVMILQQLSRRLGEDGPLIALILALALPIGYGVWDYLKHRHKNYFSLFGLLSIAMTGGFALLHLEGAWFLFKEAAFPAVMGIGVAASAFTQRPLMMSLFCNENVLQMDKISQALQMSARQEHYAALIKRATLWMSGSFFLSAALNFILAKRIFLPIDIALTATERSEILNQQIAEMTSYGFIAIALPMMVFTGIVLFIFLRQLSRLTGLSLDEMMKAS
jgi:hypothetical protein